jgi:hypothetical protein
MEVRVNERLERCATASPPSEGLPWPDSQLLPL